MFGIFLVFCEKYRLHCRCRIYSISFPSLNRWQVWMCHGKLLWVFVFTPKPLLHGLHMMQMSMCIVRWCIHLDYVYYIVFGCQFFMFHSFIHTHSSTQKTMFLQTHIRCGFDMVFNFPNRKTEKKRTREQESFWCMQPCGFVLQTLPSLYLKSCKSRKML